MKTFSICLLLLLGLEVSAESIPRDIWIVKSKEKNDSIPNNLCLITGNVYEAFSEQGVSGGIISNLNRSNSCITDDNGNFSLTVSSKDTAIFFYHESYVEIICWKYDFTGGHHVIMDFICSEKLPDGMIYIEEKPVIYAYSDERLTAKLELSNSEEFTFTYPEYHDGWEIEIGPSIKGVKVEGVDFPYLFWEGQKKDIDFSSKEGIVEGFYLKTDTAVDFIQNSLIALGFNQTESTDFITYWAPRIQKHDYSSIQFLVDDQYDLEIGELKVDPVPNAKRRVYLLFEGDNVGKPKMNIEPQKLISFERKGFTILEWGGTELTNKLKF